MRGAISIAVTAGFMAVGATGCQPGNDLAGAVCQKADGCDTLSGITAAQCKTAVNNSRQSMSGAARADAQDALNACVEMADCAS